MKIGTSLGKCLPDLLANRVDYDDVLIIVANTRVENVDQLAAVATEYWHYPQSQQRDLSNFALDTVIAMSRRLYEDGKIHQPRLTGLHLQHSLVDTWYDIIPSSASSHHSVIEAWNHYRMLSKLVNG